jgi:hypothetical protein
MLSPNARNRVNDSFGTAAVGDTTTSKEHGAALRAFASLTVQVTVVVPTGNLDPLTAVQTGVASGGVPPLALGAPKTTIAPDESAACAGAGAAGHESVGAPGSIGVGVVVPPQLTPRPPAAMRMTPRTVTENERCTVEAQQY